MTAPLQTTTAISPQVIANMKQKLRRSVLSPLVAPNPPHTTQYPNDANQRTYVQNAYRGINITGIGKMPFQLKVRTEIPLSSDYLLPDDQLQQSKDPALASAKKMSREQRYKEWLDSARTIAHRDALPGYCNLFSMVTVAILVADDSPLDKDTLVEWIGSGHGSNGHMTAVINREPQSDPADPDTWGVNYLIVDYWYALQAGVDPVFLPRTKAAIDAKRNNGTALDAHDTYRLFFDEQGEAKVFGEFRVGAYRPFKIKEKDPGLI